MSRRALVCLNLVAVALLPTAAAATSPATVVVATPVIAVVGDMACSPSDPSFNGGNGTASECAQKRTSDRLVSDETTFNIVKMVGLGDYQYGCSASSAYARSYGPSWGRLNPLIAPALGNHDYFCLPTYYSYFGTAAHEATAGEYSFDLGSWHFVSLNANCSQPGVGGCGTNSPQTSWLKRDLAASSAPCVAAFWHQPLFTGTNTVATYRPWWNALYAAGADVVLNGHIHNYQRFPPLAPGGGSDPAKGITEYIIGTGGEDLVGSSFSATPAPLVKVKTFGYMRMTLAFNSWSTTFVDAAGHVLDASSGTCHT